MKRAVETRLGGCRDALALHATRYTLWGDASLARDRGHELSLPSLASRLSSSARDHRAVIPRLAARFQLNRLYSDGILIASTTAAHAVSTATLAAPGGRKGGEGGDIIIFPHPNGLTKMPQPGGGATGTSASKDSKLPVHLVQLVKALNTSSFEPRHRDVFCAAGRITSIMR